MTTCVLNCAAGVVIPPRNSYCAVGSGVGFAREKYPIPTWLDLETTAKLAKPFTESYVPFILETFVDLTREASLMYPGTCPLQIKQTLIDTVLALIPGVSVDNIALVIDYMIASKILKPVGTWEGDIADPDGNQVKLVLVYDGYERIDMSYESFQRYVGYIYSVMRQNGEPEGTIDQAYERARFVLKQTIYVNDGGSIVGRSIGMNDLDC